MFVPWRSRVVSTSTSFRSLLWPFCLFLVFFGGVFRNAQDPSGGFNKLNFLLQNPPFPPEAFGNLLLLHIKYGYFDVAADILAENAHLTFKFLTEVFFPLCAVTLPLFSNTFCLSVSMT